eukprot:2755600-Lingulodinium_polyedra.AAC.1
MPDLFLVPAGLLRAVKNCWVDWALGRRLQLIPDQRPRDHVPIKMYVHYSLGFPEKGASRATWDLEKLGLALQTGVGRWDYLAELESSFEQEKGALAKHAEERAPDAHWARWMAILQKVGLKHFS